MINSLPDPRKLPPLAGRYAAAAAGVALLVVILIGLTRADPPGPVGPQPLLSYALLVPIFLFSLAGVIALAAGTVGRRQQRTPGERNLGNAATGTMAPFVDQDDPGEAALRLAQVRHTFDQLGAMMAVNAVNAVLVTVVIARTVDVWLLGLWLTAVLVMAALGLHARRRVREPDFELRAVSKRTVRRIALHAGVRGLLWGLCFALFFHQTSAAGQLVLLGVALGMLAGGVPALAPVPAAALMFGLGIAVPTILRLVASPGAAYLVLAAFGLAFSGSMATIGLQLYRNFARNLIARRRQEEQAATISLLLAEFETSASDWLWESDAAGRLVRLPERMRVLFGLPAGQDATLEACLARSGGHGRLAIAERLAANAAFRRIVLRTRDSDGAPHWVALTASPKPDGGWRGVGADITSEMQAEELATTARRRAEQAELRLAEAIDAVGAGFVVTDALDRVVIANKRFARMFPAGSTLATDATFEQRAKAQAALWSPEAVRMSPAWLTTLLAARRELDRCVDIRLPDESWLRVEATPTAEGGVVTVLTDISDIKEQEAQLAEQAVRLGRSNQDLQQFAAVASHDLQEPLRKIETFASRLKRKAAGALDPEATHYVERMADASGRMRRLVTDLLAFSRVARSEPPDDSVDLDRVAATVVDDLAIRIEEKAAIVTLGPLGAVPGDETLLRQLMQNLIANALKFTRPDVAPVVEITAAPVPERQTVEIRIRDNGIGFDMSHHEKMFEIFQRLNGRDSYDGSGIGLATCRRIVEHHGGSIRAESSPGEGATFIVTLPSARPAATSDRPRATSAATAV